MTRNNISIPQTLPVCKEKNANFCNFWFLHKNLLRYFTDLPIAFPKKI